MTIDGAFVSCNDVLGRSSQSIPTASDAMHSDGERAQLTRGECRVTNIRRRLLLEDRDFLYADTSYRTRPPARARSADLVAALSADCQHSSCARPSPRLVTRSLAKHP